MRLHQKTKAQANIVSIFFVSLLVILAAILLFWSITNIAEEQATQQIELGEQRTSLLNNPIDEQTTFIQTSHDTNCPYTTGEDVDGDGIIDLCDNCPIHYNPEQLDKDDDNLGDTCDPKDDDKRNKGSSNKDDDKIICEQNSDCGTDGFLNTPFCSNGNVEQTFREFTCNNPGKGSSCSHEDTTQIIEICTDSCSNGQCVTEEIICSFDSDCTGGGLIDAPFCSNNDVIQVNKTFTCENPGTTESFCSPQTDTVLIEDCSETCSQGMCTSSTECTPGQTQACGLTDIGQCSLGTETCNSQGFWGSCLGAIFPTDEICDQLDNNCNGLTDEANVCQPSCQDECTFGTRQCSGTDGYQFCFDYDGNGCTEWSSKAHCDTGDSCSEGFCS